MTNDDKKFPGRWGFRSNVNDIDSSSDDQSSPYSTSEPKHQKHKPLTHLLPEENDQQILHIPQLPPRGKNQSSYEPYKLPRKREKKSRARKIDIKASDNGRSNSALIDLREYMGSLIEGVKFAREDLLKWMKDDLEKSFNSHATPRPAKKDQKQGRNSNKARRLGTRTKNPEDGVSNKLAVETKTSLETMVNENVVSVITTVGKKRNQILKGKRLERSTK